MLASLQLFHDVPCRIMDLVFSVVTHPDFDSKQLTLRNSVDVIDVVEENRLKDRMAVVLARSASEDGRVEQAGFPQFILDEVLDIIHAGRMNSIKALFEETLDNDAIYRYSFHFEEDDTLKAMTAVHRSWTILAQKALGRVLHIGRPIHEMNVLLSPVQKSIFGPWTSAVAVQFFRPVEQKEAHYCERCGQRTKSEHQYDDDGFRYECVEVNERKNAASGLKRYIAFLLVSQTSNLYTSKATPRFSPSGLICHLWRWRDEMCAWRRLPCTRWTSKHLI